MPVATTDFLVHKSDNNGEGGIRDFGAAITDNVLHNLFAEITEAEAAAGGSRTRKFFVTNDHATDTAVGPEATVALFPGAYTFEIGWGLDEADDDDAGVSGNLNPDVNPADELEILSDGADTRQVTLYGKDGSGNHLEETLTLNGTTPVAGSDLFRYVYAAVADATSGTRTVTIRKTTGPTTLGTIAINQRHGFAWLDVSTAEAPMTVDDIPASFFRGFWIRQTWPAGVAAGTSFSATFELAYT